MARTPIDNIQTLLDRPLEQRVREFKYRFAQSVVFGLPVLALQWYGPALGWVEAGRWVGVLQMLLAGWVVYVGAGGLMFEGVLLLPRRLSPDLLVAATAISCYLVSAIDVLYLLLFARSWHQPMFHLSMILLIPWTGLRWWQLSRREVATECCR